MDLSDSFGKSNNFCFNSRKDKVLELEMPEAS